jgi:hypothetical protein
LSPRHAGLLLATCALVFACEVAPTLELLQPPKPPADAGLIAMDATVVSPPDAGVARDAAVRPTLEDGEPCTANEQCLGGRCLPHPTFPGGYCTKICTDDSQCNRPSGVCFDRAGNDICARTCDDASECRDGYACFRPATEREEVCLPEALLTNRADGDPCTSDMQCRGGSCLPEPDWPGGHCTTLFCADAASCASDGAPVECVPGLRFQFEPLCVRACSTIADCRDGYACLPMFGARICVPDASETIPLDPPQTYPFEMHCGLTPVNGRVIVPYTVAPDTTSYIITPLARDGRFIVPIEIVRPSGRKIDFAGANEFQAVMSWIHGYINPTVVPAVTQHAAQLEAGPHRYVLETSSTDVCWYLIEEQTPGATLDIDVYLVGLPGITAANAGSNANLRRMFEVVGEAYAQVGIEVGTVRYHNMTSDQIDRFSIIREDNEILELVKLSARPTGGLDSILTANVFIIQTFATELGLLGVSSGLPGAAGIHGTSASGVVFTGEMLGQMVPDPLTGAPMDGNEFSGKVLAHEVGHYLGLFHTTEGDLTNHDPVLDTAECPPERFPFDCPDLLNLMFPFASNGSDLSPGQGFTIKSNPLTKD